MNHKSNYLPNLNSCFMHLQAYQQHRKKVEEIGRSRIKLKNKVKRSSPDFINQQKQQILQGSNVRIVKQSLKKSLRRRLSPKQIRDQYEIHKENSRLMQRIQKCSSTIDRKVIFRHQQKSRKIKEQLSRFVYSTLENKVILKCKQSLQVLRKRQSTIQQSSLLPSRSQSRKRYAKSQASRVDTVGTYGVNQSNQTSKKSSLKKFFLPKNPPQIQKRFETQDLHQHATKEFQTLKFNFWSKKKRIKTEMRKPTKFFQTQVEC